ncbi:MAG: triose-phosphate isomerase [Rubricella sp.]
MRPLIAGNWKMNGMKASLDEARALIAAHPDPAAEMLLCPPATLIGGMAELASGSALAIGGQDCHAEASGAHTGDVSAEMIGDAGGTHVIVGHSERRTDHGETDDIVRAKAGAAWRAGLTAIVCVGESEAERDAGHAEEVVLGQIAGSVPEGATSSNTVIAYEPVWAIGTGRTPTTDDIAAMHDAIRGKLEALFGAEGAAMRILYGGSMKPGNAAEILAVSNVNGGLVGGASLKASDFGAIVAAAG